MAETRKAYQVIDDPKGNLPPVSLQLSVIGGDPYIVIMQQRVYADCDEITLGLAQAREAVAQLQGLLPSPPPDPELVAALVDAIDDAICDDSGRVHANTLERHMQKHGLRLSKP